jgi:arachidonate 15-lipoxygenase
VDPVLPQDETDPSERLSQLAAAAEIYRYDHEALAPVALAAEVPEVEEPSLGWRLLVAQRMITLAHNSAEVDESHGDGRGNPATVLLELFKAGKKGGMKGIHEEVTQLARRGMSGGRPESLEDYAALFQELELPTVASHYREDATFAEQRVSGANPVWLRRADELPDHFPVGEEEFQASQAGDSLAAARAEGRLYLADYAVLDGLECGDYPAAQKFLNAPLALFVVPPKGSRDLQPVAIQVDQRPGPEAPIVTPRDGWAWLDAKTRVQSADGNCHQAISHLGRTHLPLDAVVLATHRQLARRHPVFLLLQPHLEGTLSINESANTSLLAPEGGVEVVMAGTNEASRAVAAKAASEWSLDDAALPRDLELRGVDDAEAFPNYPYRDDGLLIWSAIADWVQSYLALYYPDDAHVQQDRELQAWVAELISPDYGRLRGLGQSGRIRTRDYLAHVLTTLIFTASAGHAAVNFPQCTAMTYVPNWPLASFTPSRAGPLSEQDYLDLLPPLDVAHMQVSLGYLLGSIYYTQLGHYPKTLVFDYFSDARVRTPERRFTDRLAEIESQIEVRNQTRRAPYPHLLPSRIPQSTNL